jgi:hypothetical protein
VRRGDLDTSDARVRVRRAYKGGIRLAGQVDVVAVAAGTGEQARVVLAQDRLADSFARRPGPRLEERQLAAYPESEQSGDDQVDRDEIVQEPGHDEDQHAEDDREDRTQVCKADRHARLLSATTFISRA